MTVQSGTITDDSDEAVAMVALVLKRNATTLIVTHDDRTFEAPREALTEARAVKIKADILSLMAKAAHC